MQRHFMACLFAVKALLLCSCAALPHQEHYMLRSEYYRSIEEMSRKAEAEKAALRERIAALEADAGREEGRRLQSEGLLDRAASDRDKVEKELVATTAASERDMKAARSENQELLLTIERVEKELGTTRASLAACEADRQKETSVLLSDEILFPSGSSKLTKPMQERLSVLADLLHEADFLSIVGHTDDQEVKGPSYASNWALSAGRAAEVAVFLTRQLQIPDARITIVGRSAENAIKPNTSPENRSRNRRVEIFAISR